MDWKSLTSKLDPYIQKMDPYIDKAKNAGYKALDFTQKQLQNTPVVLKTMPEYELLRTSKRFILIAYDETHPDARDIVLRSPVWAARAWSDASELRFVEKGVSPDIIKNLDITTPLDMRVWYIWQETFHATDLLSIQAWWQTRLYDGSIVESPVSGEKSKNPPAQSDSIIDPLAGK